MGTEPLVCRMKLADGSILRCPKRFMDWWHSTPVNEREPEFMRERLDWYQRISEAQDGKY